MLDPVFFSRQKFTSSSTSLFPNFTQTLSWAVSTRGSHARKQHRHQMHTPPALLHTNVLYVHLPSVIERVLTERYQFSFTRASQEDDSEVTLNSRRFLDVRIRSGGDLSSCISVEILPRDSGSTMVRNAGVSGSGSGTTADFGLCNPV